MKSLFTGCGTALITPFKGGEIDWDTLDQLVEESRKARQNREDQSVDYRDKSCSG